MGIQVYGEGQWPMRARIAVFFYVFDMTISARLLHSHIGNLQSLTAMSCKVLRVIMCACFNTVTKLESQCVEGGMAHKAAHSEKRNRLCHTMPC